MVVVASPWFDVLWLHADESSSSAEGMACKICSAVKKVFSKVSAILPVRAFIIETAL